MLLLTYRSIRSCLSESWGLPPDVLAPPPCGWAGSGVDSALASLPSVMALTVSEELSSPEVDLKEREREREREREKEQK